MKIKTILLILCWGYSHFGSLGLAATIGTAPAPPLPSITVTGTGEVLARPDMARVNIGVVTQSESASAGVKQNNEAVERLFEALDEYGIAESDIQTSNFGVAPQYDYDRSGQAPRLIGYRVSNQVRVAVRGIANLGAILDRVVTAGANQINDVTFAINEAKSLEDNARRLAMADAHRKAALYAHEAGVRLGSVLRVEEAVDTVAVRQFGVAMAQEARAVPIAPGQQKLRQQVRVTFSIDVNP
jgi:uncharacterized protein YggE